jgi:hypothetical protein
MNKISNTRKNSDYGNYGFEKPPGTLDAEHGLKMAFVLPATWYLLYATARIGGAYWAYHNGDSCYLFTGWKNDIDLFRWFFIGKIMGFKGERIKDF